MRPLDFVIIGAPKAGTSSLFTWLNSHPQVQGSQPKETFFFMDEDHPLTARQWERGGVTVHEAGLGEYERFFPEPSEGRLRFEATTHYFYQETALAHFGAMQPPPLIVFVLRRQSERIRSSFQFTQENLGVISRELTFNDYVDYLLDSNLSVLDRYFYNQSSLWIAKRELELSRYDLWLERWTAAVGEDRLEVVLFEEMKQNPHVVVARLARRLGINETFWDDYEFAVRNRSIWVRHQGLHRFARRFGSLIPCSTLKSAFKSLYTRIQSTGPPVSDTTSRGKARLDEYFDPWNRKLAKRFGIGTEVWLDKHGDA